MNSKPKESLWMPDKSNGRVFCARRCRTPLLPNSLSLLLRPLPNNKKRAMWKHLCLPSNTALFYQAIRSLKAVKINQSTVWCRLQCLCLCLCPRIMSVTTADACQREGCIIVTTHIAAAIMLCSISSSNYANNNFSRHTTAVNHQTSSANTPISHSSYSTYSSAASVERQNTKSRALKERMLKLKQESNKIRDDLKRFRSTMQEVREECTN